MIIVDGVETEGDATADIATLAHETGIVRGTFTTVRVEAGALVRRAAHERRLWLEQPTRATVEQAMHEADAAAAAIGVGMVRILLGEHRVVAAAPARRPVFDLGDAPLRLALAIDRRIEDAIKSIDRRVHKATEELAHRQSFQGAVWIGAEGVREGTWFHIAALTPLGWRTPPLSPHVSFGTTRAAFIESHGATEGALRPAELFAAEQVVALSALLEIGEAEVCPDLLVPREIDGFRAED